MNKPLLQWIEPEPRTQNQPHTDGNSPQQHPLPTYAVYMVAFVTLTPIVLNLVFNSLQWLIFGTLEYEISLTRSIIAGLVGGTTAAAISWILHDGQKGPHVMALGQKTITRSRRNFFVKAVAIRRDRSRHPFR